MSEEKSYLASDLTTQLQLPRSTVNDWLTRYASYLPSEARGKRRAYSAQALAVLREIAAWRNEGKSAFEIEQLLSARYGIRPEEVTLPEDAASAPASAETKEQEEGGLPALRRPMAEVQQQITSEFSRLSDLMAEMQKMQQKSDRKARLNAFFCAVIFILAAAAVGAGVLGWREYEKKESSAAIQRQAVLRAQGNSAAGLAALESAQSKMTRELAKMRAEETRLRAELERKIAAKEKAHQEALTLERRRFSHEYAQLRSNMAMELTAAKSASAAALQGQKKEYEAKMAALSAERDALRRRLDDARAEQIKTQKELQRVRDAQKEAELQRSKQNAAMEKRLKNLTESCQVLQKQRDRERAAAQKEIAFLRSKVAGLEQRDLQIAARPAGKEVKP